NIVEKVATTLQQYQTSIKIMKREEYEIIGYCRKSPGNESVENRQRLLKHMVGRLQERSLVDKVFVSLSCKSNQPISERDSNLKKKDLNFLNKFTDGSMQGKLNWSTYSLCFKC
ncbi:hypothetical protein BDC45DRAFT_445925, partial [Circinella umbellata]